MENTFLCCSKFKLSDWLANQAMVQFLTDYLHCVHFCENISTLSKEEKQIQAYNIFALVTI